VFFYIRRKITIAAPAALYAGGRRSFAKIDVRMEYGGEHLPPSTTAEVRRLTHPGFLIESR
jgi:hypothetical protein